MSTFLDVYATRTGEHAACEHHLDNEAVAQCNLCKCFLCDVCAFTVGSATYCPTCVHAEPTPSQRAEVLKGGLFSLGAAVLGALISWEAAFPGEMEGSWVLWFPGLACAIYGAARGLISREGARRTGSPLPTLATLANALLLALQLAALARGALHG